MSPNQLLDALAAHMAQSPDAAIAQNMISALRVIAARGPAGSIQPARVINLTGDRLRAVASVGTDVARDRITEIKAALARHNASPCLDQATCERYGAELMRLEAELIRHAAPEPVQDPGPPQQTGNPSAALMAETQFAGLTDDELASRLTVLEKQYETAKASQSWGQASQLATQRNEALDEYYRRRRRTA